MSRNYNRRRSGNKIIANRQIRYPKVRVLDDQGEMLGVMSSQEAYNKAREKNTDLVLITDQAKPPVVKLIELSKHKYQLQQKEAKARKKNRQQEIKEVRLSMFMGEGDVKARINRVKRFLKDGDKVRLNLLFKGRQITKKKFGYELFAQVIKAVEDISDIETEPKIVGRKLIAQLMPKKK
ncbi:MAG: translation initiation factor IF-3 [Candidatus Pacebacteria bacterium]|nr:translation initiation factor IF-3 [Candidatus Paceibacterota bacterium]